MHVHTDEPERAVAVFDGYGEVSHLDVADMHEQVAEREQRLSAERHRRGRRPSAERAALRGRSPVASAGAGMIALYEELGALVVDGGATMNPSTNELLAGIHAAPGREVLVLPNSPNVRLAAERAAELSEQAGAGGADDRAPAGACRRCSRLRPRPGRRGERRRASPRRCRGLRLGGVAEAARDDAQGRFHSGDAVGYADGELVAWGDPAAALTATLERIAARQRAGDLHRRRRPAADQRRARGARAGRRRARVPRGRPAGLVVAALRGVAAFGSGDELTAEQALAAPVRSWPRPSLLAEPLKLRGKAANGAGRRSASPPTAT